MGSEGHVCPSCGQPVASVVRRHKTLGAVVPVWRPGPCRNPRCPAYVAPEPERTHRAQPAETGTGEPGEGTGRENA